MTPKPKTPGGKPGGGTPGDPGKGKPATKVGKVDASNVSDAQTTTGEFAAAGRPGTSSSSGLPGATPPTGGRTNIPKSKSDEIVALGRGNRPDPRTYMSQADIDAHLQPFRESGAVRFTPRESFERYGTLGPPNGTFTIPRSKLREVMDRSGGDLGKVEVELGLAPGTLTSGDTVVAYIRPEDLGGLRMPDGNEPGANEYWLPGGYTSGGVPEATIDAPADLPFEELDLT